MQKNTKSLFILSIFSTLFKKMNNSSVLFGNIPMDFIFSEESQILAAPIWCQGSHFSFFSIGTGHFNPAYKTDNNDGTI